MTLSIRSARESFWLTIIQYVIKHANYVTSDPEIQEKLALCTQCKRLQLMLQLWEDDFRREMEIWNYRVKNMTDGEIRKLLSELAEHQDLPEMNENTMGWMGANGVWHDNPNWKKVY